MLYTNPLWPTLRITPTRLEFTKARAVYSHANRYSYCSRNGGNVVQTSPYMRRRLGDVVDQDKTWCFFQLFAIKRNKHLLEVVNLGFQLFQPLSSIAIELKFVGLLRSTTEGS